MLVTTVSVVAWTTISRFTLRLGDEAAAWTVHTLAAVFSAHQPPLPVLPSRVYVCGVALEPIVEFTASDPLESYVVRREIA